MKSLSTSFTLGKASIQHNANIEHNNRKFIASNINKEKVKDNVMYINQDVNAAYHQLFDKALDEYNSKQKQPCRRIHDYFKHISDSKREEAFYEIIVQFGDMDTAPCGSESGEKCKSMLDEYVKNFQTRNPNLHVFNAVLHMDEASPHLHIDFIPFYTKGRQKGLSKGVSMKSALIEQGFDPKSIKENQLVAWEENERLEMEKILNRHGFSRDDKQADYQHKTVEQYKREKDEEKMLQALKQRSSVADNEVTKDNVKLLKLSLATLKDENDSLKKNQRTPFKSFFYANSEKQAFVQHELDKLNIPYSETENGFDAQECYVDEIRKIEKQFKPSKNSARDVLRSHIDRLVMSSDNLDDVLKKLSAMNYIVKEGKYIAVKPQGGQNFIRLKSLGENYSELAIGNRINSRKKYELNLHNKVNSISDKGSMDFIFSKTIQFYTITFKKVALPMNKRDTKKPFAWTNDSELDRLLALNAKINHGATLESLRRDFESADKNLSEKEKMLEQSQKVLNEFVDLKEQCHIVFENLPSDKFTKTQAESALRLYPDINKNNFENVDILIRNEKENIVKLESELVQAKEKLKQAADDFSAVEKICSGTYVQGLVAAEKQRRESYHKIIF